MKDVCKAGIFSSKRCISVINGVNHTRGSCAICGTRKQGLSNSCRTAKCKLSVRCNGHFNATANCIRPRVRLLFSELNDTSCSTTDSFSKSGGVRIRRSDVDDFVNHLNVTTKETARGNGLCTGTDVLRRFGKSATTAFDTRKRSASHIRRSFNSA